MESKPSCSIFTPYSTKAFASGISGYAVKFRAAMPNVPDKLAIENSSVGTNRIRARLGGVEPLGIEFAQYFHFLIGRRLRGVHVIGKDQLESSIFLHLL